MKIEVNITDAELSAIRWLQNRPATYKFDEFKLRKRLAERFLERVVKCVPVTATCNSSVRQSQSRRPAPSPHASS